MKNHIEFYLRQHFSIIHDTSDVLRNTGLEINSLRQTDTVFFFFILYHLPFISRSYPVKYSQSLNYFPKGGFVNLVSKLSKKWKKDEIQLLCSHAINPCIHLFFHLPLNKICACLCSKPVGHRIKPSKVGSCP